MEYAHNTLLSSTPAMSPFQCLHGYQPPLFSSQEQELAVPPIQAHMRQCHRMWRHARAALLKTIGRYERLANRHRSTAPVYTPGQRVWLSAKDLPLRTDFHKLAPWFIGSFLVENVINPAVVQLKLPRSMRVHPAFHVFCVKPVVTSPLVLPTPQPQSPVVIPCARGTSNHEPLP